MRLILVFVASLVIGLSQQQQKGDINKDLDWIQVQREAVTKIIVFVCLLALVGLIIWKVWDVKNTVVKNKVLMEEFED